MCLACIELNFIRLIKSSDSDSEKQNFQHLKVQMMAYEYLSEVKSEFDILFGCDGENVSQATPVKNHCFMDCLNIIKLF